MCVQTVCLSTASFIAHLVNQSVAHELLPLQLLLLLLETPTSDSIEIACALTREVGAFLAEHSSKPNNLIFERFRAVLHEGNIEKRVQYMIEVLFQTRKDKYKDNPILPEGLDLVEEDEQITHKVLLDDELPVQEGLSESASTETRAKMAPAGPSQAKLTTLSPLPADIFKADPNFLENEDKYKSIKAEILGDSDDDESGSSGSGSESDDEDESEAEGGEGEQLVFIALHTVTLCHSADHFNLNLSVVPNRHGIKDMTETNMINLRRTIYLTIMNSVGPAFVRP